MPSLPLVTMLYFMVSEKRKEESVDFNCNNLQRLNVLRNTSSFSDFVNDPQPL